MSRLKTQRANLTTCKQTKDACPEGAAATALLRWQHRLLNGSTDMLSLLGFKEAITNDPLGVLSSWNKSIHFCSWKGVWCSPKHPGRVTALNLAGQGLSGTIAVSVGNLTSVRSVDLSSNNFSGQIPHLANLQKMQVLNLSFNTLDGIIQDTLTNCSNLRKLDLYTNLLKV